MSEISPEEPVVNKNKRYRRDKPWNNDPTVDKFEIEDFKPEHNPHNGVIEESSLKCYSISIEKSISKRFGLLSKKHSSRLRSKRISTQVKTQRRLIALDILGTHMRS